MKRLLQTRSKMVVNKDLLSRQNVRGKEHIIVSGVSHMIGDAVMNQIKYPLDETVKLSNGMANKRVVMPSSHPVGDNGEFISASDPLALASNFIGAFAFNFSMRGDRLISDVAIDPSVASNSESGRQIIQAIENGDPIDVSTGFFLNIDDEEGFGNDGEPFTGIASSLHLDHVAFLPNEVGAKNKLEGVGLHVNSATDNDGNTLDTDIVDLFSNASTPALQLPIAPNDHVWNQAAAIERIKVFTNSTEKPSTNFRKFFLNFDQDNADSFDAYTNAFADIIDGKPFAVKQPLQQATNSESAKLYLTRIASNSSKDGVFNRLLAWARNMGYNDEQNKPTNNDDGDSIMDRTELIALLAAKNISVNADISDADLKAKLTEAMNTKADPVPAPVVNALTLEEVTTAINTAVEAAVTPLKEQLSANADKELETVVAQVVALNKGIDEVAAKAMGLAACNAFLAANGTPAFNSNGHPRQLNNADDDNGLDNDLPE
jgi:hypothetical protein